jgi:hypothetical protein
LSVFIWRAEHFGLSRARCSRQTGKSFTKSLRRILRSLQRRRMPFVAAKW